MKATRIKIVVVKPLQEPEVVVIGNKLENFQKIVDGLIECVPYEGYDIVVGEESKLIRNILNRKFYSDLLVGTFFITKADEEGAWVSLTDGEIKEVKEKFKIDSKEFPALIGVWEGM